ncbi:Long-chain-fatty-acid--CoA ligase 5, partial [Hypsibius exemplaris]
MTQLQSMMLNSTTMLPVDEGHEQYCVQVNSTNASSVAVRSSAAFELQIQMCIAVSVILCFTGALTNGGLLIVVLKFESLRKGAGIFIAHLLLCQLILLATVLPVGIHTVSLAAKSRANGGTQVHCEVCVFQQSAGMALFYLINFTEALLALNRLIGVYYPTKYHIINRRIFHVVGLAFCWTLSLGFTVPPIFQLGALYQMSPLGNCVVTVVSQKSRAPLVLLLALYVYVPLIFTTVAAVLISMRLISSHRAVAPTRKANSTPGNDDGSRSAPPHNSTRQPNMSERQRRMSKMLITSFAVNFLCQLPQFILAASGLIMRYPVALLWTTALLSFQFLVTPITFLVRNEDYRNKARELLYRSIRRPHRGHPEQRSQSRTSARQRQSRSIKTQESP